MADEREFGFLSPGDRRFLLFCVCLLVWGERGIGTACELASKAEEIFRRSEAEV